MSPVRLRREKNNNTTEVEKNGRSLKKVQRGKGKITVSGVKKKKKGFPSF